MARWVTVMRADEVPPDRPVTVRVNNRDLALVVRSDGGTPAVLDNHCPHRGGQLADGRVDGENIICPLHAYDFDLRTGVSRYDPSERVATYPARAHEGAIQVDADAVPELPDEHDAGYLERWARRNDPEIRGYGYLHGLAGGPATSAMGTRQPLRPTWDDILLIPAQLARQPRLDDEPLSLATTIGRRARRPLELAVPFTISHMSFGALSASAKTALARVSAELGTAIGSGEGGMLDEERDAATLEIFEMATGYFGWDEAQIRRADAIEIKFGQSAKAGSGGLLPGEKVTERIAEVRGIKPGEAAHSPARFTDIAGPDALRARVDWIRERNDGRPIGIKFAAGRVEDDLDAAIAAGADFVTIDGRGGGTGAGPDVLKDHLTIPIQYALDRAVRHLAARGIDDLDIIATGGFRTAGDVTKALALGANAVAFATGAMIAIGCQQYLACHTGRCPVGIATQQAELEARFDVARSAELGAATLGGLRDEIAMLLRAIGLADVRSLSVDDLATLDSEIAGHTRIRHA